MKHDQAEKLREMARTREGRPARKVRIIAVSSGKGGVGKSNLSVNLGITFAQMGRRTVVLDGDFGLANVNILLGIIPKYTISAVLKGQKTLKDILIETPSGMKIIAGASGLAELADVGDREKDLLIDQFDEFNDYDIMIIDTGAGISRNVVDFVMIADEVLVVTTPEPTAITDAYGLIKTIATRDEHKTAVRLVVNQVVNRAEGKATAARLITIATQFLGIVVTDFGYINKDPHVDRAVREQIPFVEKYPGSPAAACIKALAGAVLDLKESERQESLSSIFKRVLFRNG